MQSGANARQVGGDHYKAGGEFQHWDLIDHYRIGYLEGCATKYIARWRRKNGVEDLRKADHYVEKLMSCRSRAQGWAPLPRILDFCRKNELNSAEIDCMVVLCTDWNPDDLPGVRDRIAQMIREAA